MFTTLKNKWKNGPSLGGFKTANGGVAAIEMAFVLPLFITMLTGGVEVTNFASAKMKIAQLALHAADHASRMASSTALQNVPVTEADVIDVMDGTLLQGDNLDVRTHGRVIISSLQRNASGGQWIAWQRCRGNASLPSTHGVQGAGSTGTGFAGMGYTGKKFTARANEAVMFAEIRYEYDSIFDIYDEIIGRNMFSEIAAFNVRDDRDLTKIYPAAGVAAATC